MKNINIELSDSVYDEKTGISKVIIECELGRFEGIAKLSPEDREAGLASRFEGCKYAETRAIIKCLKALRMRKKSELKALEDLEKILISLKTFDPKRPEFRHLRKSIHIKNGQIKEVENLIEQVKAGLQKSIETRTEILERINRQRNEDKNN